MMRRFLSPLMIFLALSGSSRSDDGPGTLPIGSEGVPLNLGFEAGTLKDWRVEGEAFSGSLVDGDAVAKRRGDMKSGHEGKFWVGSFEQSGDAPRGYLSSVPFLVKKPWASFLVGGGSHKETRVEIVRVDTQAPIFEARGEDVEDMKRVAVDLSKYQNVGVYVRLVDLRSDGWGHINFDDFRLHDRRPPGASVPQPTSPDTYAHSGLNPDQAASAMALPPGFRVSLFAGEPDVVQPIAMAIDDRGRVWVAEAYSYPHRAAPEQARDRILIFEDADNDGKFDKRTVFAEKLNLVSGIEVGFGGVFVGAAPEFLFIADKDGDDRPDGPPQILLDGWGQHDTHETLNSFAWGPDGWLYGCHGVFTHSNVGKPGAKDSDRTPINAGIWRYHPKKQRFEVFAHGTSNPWGIDWDAKGQAFLTSCVIPHLYHVLPGGRYERQAGSHFNPFTFDDIKTVADHRHYVGDNPHRANNRSDSMGGGHAHSGAMFVLGDSWPEPYRGSLLMNNIHGARLNRDTLAARGSGFVGSHAPDFLLSNDEWSQIVSLKQGPDGSMFMIDWYDKNQCHRVEDGAHDRTNGRIFKVSYGEPRAAGVDLSKATDPELVALQTQPNEWLSRHARRLIQERGRPEAVAEAALELLNATDPTTRLRGLWALHAAGGLSPAEVIPILGNDDANLRAWSIRLAVEDGPPPDAILAEFAALAKSDPSPVVRLALASASQRIPVEKRWSIVQGLASHAEDADDPNLPLMIWYAAEPLGELDPSRAIALAEAAKLPTLLPFMARRVAAIGSDEAIALLVGTLGRTPDADRKRSVLEGIAEALKGRREVAMPASWPAVYESLSKEADPAIRSRATMLGANFGDRAALDALLGVLDDLRSPSERRVEALAALLKARDARLPERLRALLSSVGPIRGAALRGLAGYEDAATPAAILAAYANLDASEKRDALNTLAARPDFAKALLSAVESKALASADLSADLVRQLRSLDDEEVKAQIARVWGAVAETSADKAKLIAKYRAIARAGYTEPPDPVLGRAVFVKTCSQCHMLFGAGGKVGPELTGSNRADLEYVLSNVLDPNALIGKDYLAHVVATADGRVLTGIIRSEDKDALTLVTANETLTIPAGDVEDRKGSDKSMMPDDLWAPLSDHEVRSLVAYLASPSQVPQLATPETAATFFDGKTLAGWRGDEKLWSVEEREIVGRTPGLQRNEFLVSDLAAADFKLTFEVKLSKDEGNSGIQFRSTPLPDGELKGYQADIGPGWWGKLYEENGRGLLWKETGEAHVAKGEWNAYEIMAVGSKITTKINGKKCVDLDDPDGARRGVFGLQLHSGGPIEVRFRSLRLEPLGRADRSD